MKKLLPIITLFLIGCGQGFEVKQVRNVEPLLENYVKEFEDTYQVNVNYTVKFGTLENNVVGNCYIKGSKKTVTIDTEFFEYYENNEGALHQLVFHELGHCSFLLGHNDEINNQGYEKSIMNSYAFGMFTYYMQNLDYYVNSLGDQRAVPWNSEINWSCKHE